MSLKIIIDKQRESNFLFHLFPFPFLFFSLIKENHWECRIFTLLRRKRKWKQFLIINSKLNQKRRERESN